MSKLHLWGVHGLYTSRVSRHTHTLTQNGFPPQTLFTHLFCCMHTMSLFCSLLTIWIVPMCMPHWESLGCQTDTFWGVHELYTRRVYSSSVLPCQAHWFWIEVLLLVVADWLLELIFYVYCYDLQTNTLNVIWVDVLCSYKIHCDLVHVGITAVSYLVTLRSQRSSCCLKHLLHGARAFVSAVPCGSSFCDIKQENNALNST